MDDGQNNIYKVEISRQGNGGAKLTNIDNAELTYVLHRVAEDDNSITGRTIEVAGQTDLGNM